MTIRNRELSQFGSFIYVENSTQEIGITTGAFPYVGIGTTNPQYKLHVIGDTNISGVISATGFYLNGNSLVDASIQYWESSGSDVYRTSGSVGIGSTIPAYTLDVAGEIQATRFHSKQTTGTSPFVVQSQTLVANLNADLLDGKNAPSGEIVGTSDNQTLTTKTINLSSNTISGTLTQFNTALSDDNFVSLTGSETLTNKTLTTPVISAISNSGLQTVPTGNGTLVSTNSVGVVTTGMIFDGTITNSDISASAAIAVSKLASSTISGVSLGSTLSTLTFNSTYLSGTSYNGTSAVTLGVKANSDGSDPTGFPVVARDATGSFSAGNSGTITAKDFNSTSYRVNGTTVIDGSRNLINTTNASFSGIVTATDFNSTSDKNLKTNIETVQNGLDTVNLLRGVSFNWKETGKSSYGVIAQELEEILPELVNTGDVKSVNYNGIIGVLIEAIKELSAEVEELKKITK